MIPEGTAELWAALWAARGEELKAEHAFRDHINEDGCKG